MKTGVSLSLFDGTETAPILFRNNIDENIPLIKEIGYDGVDLFVNDPLAQISKEAAELLRKNKLGVGVVMPAALAGEGLFLGDKDKKVRENIIIKLKEIIEYAAQFEAMVSLGLIRGSVEDKNDSVEELLKRFTDSVSKILPFAQKNKVKLVVEPINRYEINTLNSAVESYDYIEQSGLELYLMLDTFHMNIEDVSIIDSLKYCAERIKHVHFVDSNRLAPSMGHMDMVKIYKTLKEINFEGYLCLETLQGNDYLETAKKGMEFFKSVGLK